MTTRARFATVLLAWAAAVSTTLPAARAAERDDMPIEVLIDEGRTRSADASRALLALQEAAPPGSTRRREALLARGGLAVAMRQFDEAESLARELDAQNLAQPDATTRAAALLLRARIAERRGDTRAVEPLATQSLALLPADAPPLIRYRHVRMVAWLRTTGGKLEEGARLWHEAMALADTSGLATRRTAARSTLAYTYYFAGQIGPARQINDEAIAIAEKARDWMSLSMAHNTDSILHEGDVPAQRKALLNALDFARRAGARSEEALYLSNISDLYLTDDPKTAIAYAERGLQVARELKDENTEAGALTNMGLGLVAMHRLEAGKRLVDDAIVIQRRMGREAVIVVIKRELGAALERAGDTAAAVSAFHAHRRDADAMLASGTHKKVLAIQEQFDASQRTTRLALLNRESQLKDEQLQHSALMQRLWWLLAAVSVLAIAGVTLLYRRVRRTNNALVASNQMLKVQSERDPLTGLANRRYFQAAMQTLAPGGQIVGTLCLIDVDHFKRINDDLGHAAGDAVLEEVSRRLRTALRDDDMVVRWGGEEFLVVMQTGGPAMAALLAQRLLDALGSEPVQHDGQPIAVSASIGFATFPIAPAQVGVAWERAVRLVDAAMYLAKAHGRNRAYGVALSDARDETAIDGVVRDLEAAVHAGRVTLTLLRGHEPVPAPCEEMTP